MVVEGNKGVLELLGSSNETQRIYVTNCHEIDTIRNLALTKGVDIIEVSSKDMEIMSSLRTAPGVLAIGKIANSSIEDIIANLKDTTRTGVPTLLVLDDLSDPGNVGTLIRTADWFGLAGIICSPRTADIWNPKTIQSSMGSVFRMPICIADPLNVIATFKLQAVALDSSGENIYTSDFMPDAFIVGSESHGVNTDLIDSCSTTWAIPGSGGAESLNAAIAGAVVSSELARRCSMT
jgi:TrmH family RNA methyltransferase